MKKSKPSKITKSTVDRELEKDYKDILETPYQEMSGLGRRYLDCVIDPKRASPARIPTLMGGDPGLTSLIKTKIETTVTIGTSGFGYILLGSPSYNGFYSDRSAICYTGASFAGTTVSAGAATGVNFAAFPTPYTAASATQQYDYRLVGMSVEVFPTSSVTNQNGSIGMLEPASRSSLGGSNADQLGSWTRARYVRGTQIGDPSVKVVLNIHPQEQVILNAPTSTLSPFEFINFSGGAAVLDANGQAGIVWFEGIAGTNFKFEVYATYEFRGKGAPNPKVGLTNERDMNLALNTFRFKSLSGWVGHPMDAHRGYREVLLKVLDKVEENPTVQRLIKQVPSYALNMFKSLAGF